MASDLALSASISGLKFNILEPQGIISCSANSCYTASHSTLSFSSSITNNSFSIIRTIPSQSNPKGFKIYSSTPSSEYDSGTVDASESPSSPPILPVDIESNEWLQFNLRKNEAQVPDEWKDKRTKQDEETMLKEGVTIRKHPPMGTLSHPVGTFEFIVPSEENIPRNILEEIVWNKGVELTRLKEKMPLSKLLPAMSCSPPPRDFVATLKARFQETQRPALIAEVKKASPSKGVIQPNFDPVKIAQAYEKGGAACLSVLTDSKYFQGSFDNLKSIQASGVQCPLLCKEFIIDAWQIYFARLKGADAILLIAAVLTNQDLRYLTKIAKKLGMASLIEVHTEQEMTRVLSLEDVELIGINNRDLGTFKVDIKNTENLLSGENYQAILKRDILIVAESGLSTVDDIAYVQKVGCKAILVGESLVKQDDLTSAITNLIGKDISRNPTNTIPSSIVI